MRPGCIAVLIGLGVSLVCACPVSAQSDLESGLNSCIDRFRESAPPEQLDLEAECPDLHRALQDGIPSEVWPPLKNLAPYEQLLDLRHTLAVRQEALPEGRTLDPSRLASLLASVVSVEPHAQPEKGVWERFIAWLEEKLAIKDYRTVADDIFK